MYFGVCGPNKFCSMYFGACGPNKWSYSHSMFADIIHYITWTFSMIVFCLDSIVSFLLHIYIETSILKTIICFFGSFTNFASKWKYVL